MENCSAWMSGDKRTALLVFVAICLQAILIYLSAVIDNTYYVTHLLNRGIPNIQVGLIGMIPAVGNVLMAFYDFLYYLLHIKKFPLRGVGIIIMATMIVNCAGQGVVEYLPKEYNQLLSALLMLQKLFQGILVFLCCKVYVEECNVWFPDHVTLILGLVVSTNYIGGATGILMGGYLYDLLSFNEPYLIASLICGVCLLFSFFVLPPTSDPLYRKAKVEGNDDQAGYENAQSTTVEETTEIAAVSKEKGLTWLVVFPLVAHGLCAISEGFISAITTPYLQDEFGMEISQGSRYVFVMYIAFIIGSTVAGYTLQMGWVSPFKTMGTGSAFTMIGLLLMFPGQGSKKVYDLVPELASLGNVLIGIGNQFISIAALEALEVTHVTIARREYTGKSKSLAESLWILGWWISVYVGHLLTLMVMKYMTFTSGGWVVAGCSGLSVCVCAVFEVWTIRSSRSLVVTPVEPSPSLIISNQTVL